MLALAAAARGATRLACAAGGRTMKAPTIWLMLALATPATAWAAGIPDEDQTPVEQCENLPASASIGQLRAAETLAVCSEMTRILEGVTIGDLRTFSTVAVLLSAKGYERWKYAEITRELVEIIRLRGLHENEPRQKPTLEIVWKTREGAKGVI